MSSPTDLPAVYDGTGTYKNKYGQPESSSISNPNLSTDQTARDAAAAAQTTANSKATPITVAAVATAGAALAVDTHTPVDASGATRTMTLPAAAPGNAGKLIVVEKRDSSPNTVTVSGSIRGSNSSVNLAWQYETIEFVADSAGSWVPVAGHKTKKSLDDSYIGISPSGDTSGATDQAKIQAALTAAAAAGGGAVLLAAGTFYVTGLTIDSNVHLRGAGDATVVQLANSANTHVVQSLNFATLTGTDTTATPHNMAISALIIDGNRTNQTGTCHGVALYAYGFSLRDIKVRNALSYGVWSEWGTSSSNPGADSMEASITNFKIHGCGGVGLLMRGPHDTHVINGIIYDNCKTYVASVGALDISGNLGANGSIVDDVHVWGNNAADYGIRITTSGIMLGHGVQVENAAIAQLLVSNSSNRVNGKLFSGGVTQTTVKGLVISGSSSNISGKLKVENCGGGALDISGSNGNLNLDVFASYSTTPAPSTGITGTPKTWDTIIYAQIDANGVPTADSGLYTTALQVRGFGRGVGVTVPRPASGEYIVPLTGGTGTDSAAWTLGRVFYAPVEIAYPTAVTGLGLNLNSSGAGGSSPLMHLALYADDGTGTRPSGAIITGTEVTFDPTATTGDKVVAFSGGNKTLQPGRYWAAAMLTSAGGTAMGTVPGFVTATSLLNQTGVANLSNASRRTWQQDAGSSATAFPTASAGSLARTGTVPFVGLTVA